MPGIFISYRREDSAGHAGRLYDRLSQHFGRSRVFMDVAQIEAGLDFVEAIEQAVGSCQVLLVMIGREWLTSADERGRRRLDDPHDFVRLEVAAALSRNVRVIPVLVEGAKIPTAQDLPDDLARLSRRQAVELRDSRWDADVQDLIAVAGKALEGEERLAQTATTRLESGTSATAETPPPPPAARGTRRSGGLRSRGIRIAAGGITALILAGLALFFALRGSRPEMVGVPDVVGQSLEAAVDQIRRAGLQQGELQAQPTKDVPPKQVLSQSPSPGTRVDPNTRVTLVIAEPPPRVVPDVVGKLVPEAEEILRKAGLQIREITEEAAARAPERTVLRQEPQAGVEVSGEETGVRLVVARPRAPAPDTVVVPDVVGTGLDLALEKLRRAGLSPRSQAGKPDRARPQNQVVSQEPGAGAKVARGAQVVVVFNPLAKLRVPDVVGKPLAEARSILAQSGFGVRVRPEPQDKPLPDAVLGQSPEPGTEVFEAEAMVELRVPAPREKPPEAQPTVFVYYSGERSKANATGLAEYLQRIGLNPQPAEQVRSIAQGRVHYFYAQDEERATAVAKRSMVWLSKTARQEVKLELAYVEPTRFKAARPGVISIWIPSLPEVPAARVTTRAKGTLRIPQTYQADLDDGVLRTGDPADIWFEAVTDTQRFLTFLGNTGFAKPPRRGPSLEDCIAAKYGRGRIPMDRLPEGSEFCVRTNGGRYAALRVDRPIGPSPGTLEITYITWETR
jgi:beta-lactam-binding protein with PASTA domain